MQFSARLRLDANDPAIGDDETKMKFADHVLEIMELTDIATLQVGSFEEGGLSFEQRKRLAIACELAGSPSVIFLVSYSVYSNLYRFAPILTISILFAPG